MSDRRPSVGWPTREQTLLVRAAVCSPASARAAFDQWRSRVDPERLDYGSLRLFPSVYLNLPDLNEDDAVVRSMRERFERTRSDNERRLATVASIIGRLRGAGIDTLLLKGIALVASGRSSAGARPMDDLDLLVPDEQALKARDELVSDGWKLRRAMSQETLSVGHGVDLSHPRSERLDLHWHVFTECCEPGSDAELWHAAEPLVVNGVPTRMLCPADFLLHVTAHGLRWSIVPPVRWAVDAVTIVRAAGSRFDWDRLVREAIGRSLMLPVIDALTYLRHELDIDVPDTVLNRLRSAPTSPLLVAEHRVRLQPRSRVRQARYHWIRHRRLSHRTLLVDLIRYPDYLRRFWGFRTYGALARHVLDRLTR